jgi:hypothetical protein
MKTLFILLVFIGSLHSFLHAQINSVVNIGITGESILCTDGYIDDQGNKIAIMATEAGTAIASFNSIFAPNWVKIVSDYSSTINTIIRLSNGDFIALIGQDFSYESHVLKFDALGNIHWHKKLASPGSGLNQAIEIGDNKIAMVGRNGANALYTVFDFDGDIVYSKMLNSVVYPDEHIRDILPTGDGNHLIVSQIFDSGSPKILLSKFNESGELLWDKLHDFPFTVTVRNGLSSSDGDLFLVGNYNPSMVIADFDSRELLLLKFSSEGDFLQASTYGNIFEEDLFDLEEDVDGTFIGIGMLKSSGGCSGNLLVVNFDQNLDTLYTKIYGTEVGNGAFFNELHKKGNDYYSFGFGSLWTNIGASGDGHLIQSDKYFDLGCEFYDSGLQNSGTVTQELITSDVTYPTSDPNFIDDALEIAVSLIVKDACTGEILSAEALNPAPAQLSVFPVPARDYLNIRMNTTELEELAIYDLKGRLFFQQSGGFADEFTLKIEEWPSQQYILVGKHKDGVQFEKILKID